MKISLRKKVIVIAVFFLIWTLGLMMFYATTLQLGLMSQLNGYIGYCSSVKLPFILEIILAEIVLITVFCSLYIYAEFFKLTKKVLRFTLIIAILNLGFLAYQVIQYPLLLCISLGWGNNPDKVDALSHPLLYVSLCFAFLIILLTYRNKKVLVHQSFTRMIHSLTTLIIVVEVISRINVNYQVCIG